jgi:hypothetical protein
MDLMNYIKIFEDGTSEAVDVKPSWGVDANTDTEFVEAGTKDFYKDGKWSSKTILNEYVDSIDPFGDGSLVAKYQLNGNADDLTGNYNGTATNVTYDTGKLGQAGVFNGSSSQITRANIPESSVRSVSIWVKFNSFDTTNYVYSEGTYASGKYLAINTDASGHVNLYNGSSNIGTLVLSTGVWYHLVLEVNYTNSTKLYINGNIEKSIGGVTYDSSELNIGRFYQTQSHYGVNGSIDQVGIYNRELTQEEVTRLYYEGIPTITEYTEQFTYLSNKGKLAGIEVANGVPVDIHYTELAPDINIDCIVTNELSSFNGNVKIVDFGTVYTDNRYVIDNPFGNENYKGCIVRAEVYYNGMWSGSGIFNDGASSYAGTNAHSNIEGIVVQTLASAVIQGLSGGSRVSGGGHGTIASNISSAPCRVIVTYIGEATNV